MAIQIIRDQEQAAQLREVGLLWRCYDGNRLFALDDGWWTAADIRSACWPVYEGDALTFAVLLEE